MSTGQLSARIQVTNDMPSDVQQQLEAMCSDLRRRQVKGSFPTAWMTVNLLLKLVSTARIQSMDSLVEMVRSVGRSLELAAPREFCIGNVVRRVLHLIREEYSELPTQTLDHHIPADREQHEKVPGGRSMVTLLSQPASTPKSTGGTERDVKPFIVEGIRELMDEIRHESDGIAAQSLDLVHTNEVILTLGASVTVKNFLLRAAERRSFTVLLVESYPNHLRETQELSLVLSKAGIETILVPDQAVYALMSRVNKVLLSTLAVLANGGLVAQAGTRTICQAAKEWSVQVVVCTGIYKLSPLYPYDMEALVELGDPSAVLAYDDPLMEKVHVVNPLQDYVPPHLISLYISNLGGHPPSYVYRIVLDHYDQEDIKL